MRYGEAVFSAIRSFFDPLHNTVEALGWLRENRNDAALACNRFHSTENAICFIQSLYDAGAEAVVIPLNRIFNEQWRLAQDAGPYARDLLVVLPKDQEKRRAVWQICELEYQRELEGFWEPSPPDYTPSRGLVYLRWS